MPLPYATLHGAAGIAVPTLVSTLAISCVFTSVVFLEGPAKYLFTPLGLAVVFAMLASYGLSRTLTPITIGLLLKGERHGSADARRGPVRSHSCGLRARLRADAHRLCRAADGAARRRLIVPIVAVLVLGLGGDADARRARLLSGHRRRADQAPRPRPGRNPDRSDRAIFQAVEDKIREVIPERERQLIVDNIGLPARAYNLAFADGSTIGVNDGVILVALKDGHAPTGDYVRKLRSPPGRLPPGDLLFPSRRHGHANPQFRAAVANRRPHRRLRSSDQPAGCERNSSSASLRFRRCRCAPAAGSRRAGVLRHDRPRARGSAWPQRQHHRHQPQCQPELVRTGHAQFLDRSRPREFPITSRSRHRNARWARSIDLGNTPVSAAMRWRRTCGRSRDC